MIALISRSRFFPENDCHNPRFLHRPLLSAKIVVRPGAQGSTHVLLVIIQDFSFKTSHVHTFILITLQSF